MPCPKNLCSGDEKKVESILYMFRLLLFAIFAYFFYLFFWTEVQTEPFEGSVKVIRILTGEETRKIICAKRGTLEVQRTVGEQPAVAPRVSTHILSGADISRGTLDNYYDTFSALDLRARGVSSLNEYLRRIESVCCDCDAHKESIIRRCINKVDFEKIHGHGAPTWINMGRLRALPWTIAVTKGKGLAYEYGLPHTRGDVIIIPESAVSDTDEFVDTLMHEQLHVYQKMYPEDFQKYLDSEGFVRHCWRKEIQNVAANPDADEWVYSKDGEIFVGQYTGGGDDYKSVTFKPINHPRYDCPQEYAVY